MGSFVSSVCSNRPSLHLFVSLSVCQSVTRPPFVSLFLRRPVNPFILPFIHPSVFPCLVCPSVRPPSFNSFVSLSVCPFVCQSIRFPSVCPFIHTFECPFLLPSMRLSICPSVHPVLLSIYNGSWLMAPEIYLYYCKGIEIHAGVQNPTLIAYYANQTLGFE